MTMGRSVFVGILAALFAAFVWALNFIVPFVIGGYSVFDLALIRFAVTGLICLVFILIRRREVRALTVRDWVLTLWLGVIGYLGYFLALVGAATYAGPVVAPAIIGLVPIVLAIAGNWRQRTVPWRALAIPLALTALGLILVHVNSTQHVSAGLSSPIGIALAISAVLLWTWFGLLNQEALLRHPKMDPAIWTAMIMLGAAAGMLTFAPIGYVAGTFQFPTLGLRWHSAAALYGWSIGLALVATIGGALAWTIASQRLPVALAAQLVVMEAVFGALVGLAIHRRWPTATEITGMAVLVAGVLKAIRVFSAAAMPAPTAFPSP
jgi:drug/metabolite transporter (DMT)-like permease